jgi:hypothetical protein
VSSAKAHNVEEAQLFPAKKMPAFDAMTVSPVTQRNTEISAYVPVREKLVTTLLQVFRCQGECAKLLARTDEVIE